jgi:hypothetical protein
MTCSREKIWVAIVKRRIHAKKINLVILACSRRITATTINLGKRGVF